MTALDPDYMPFAEWLEGQQADPEDPAGLLMQHLADLPELRYCEDFDAIFDLLPAREEIRSAFPEVWAAYRQAAAEAEAARERLHADRVLSIRFTQRITVGSGEEVLESLAALTTAGMIVRGVDLESHEHGRPTRVVSLDLLGSVRQMLRACPGLWKSRSDLLDILYANLYREFGRAVRLTLEDLASSVSA